MRVQLVRIFDDLPEAFEALRREAAAEGYGHLNRLAEEWSAGVQRFDRDGAALLAAWRADDLVAIGGLTPEPTPAPGPALRMRRLYVAPRARRQGVATVLCNALLQEALPQAVLVTVNAGGGEAAAFWQAMGFEAEAGQAWSHALRRPTSAG